MAKISEDYIIRNAREATSDATEEDDSFFYKVGLTVVEALTDYNCEFEVLSQVWLLGVISQWGYKVVVRKRQSRLFE